jgi:RNA polymerase I-specific transcription initiation factor RRN6
MTDTKKSAPPRERPLPNVALQHRLNHIAYGNLGRVAYSPVDHDDQLVGKLQINRSVESDQYFGLLSDFTEVLPPTRSAPLEELSGQKPSDAARSQNNWLLEHHPQAVTGGLVDAQILADELKRFKTVAVEDGSASTSSLLAVGEITDRTDVHSGTVGQPAIAMAAGEGGHVLRIIGLDQQDAAWPDKDLSVRVTKVSSSARGDWGEDGVPITLIKFAVDGRRYDPIRWLLVQRPTGTALFEPEITIMPFQGGMSEYEQSHLYSQMPRCISANPLFTIEARKTGGAVHVDACFNPVVDGRFPQLAIIDELGRWTVWDITGSRSAAPKILQPIVTARGSIDISPLPSLQTRLGRGSATHKLLYVLPKGERRVRREDEQEGTEHQHWGLYSRSPVRCNHVLVCSDTDVRLYEARAGTQLAGMRVVNVNRGESIVDMQSCPISASQVFVLTTSSLYWIDTKVARDGQVRLSIILSFPHHRRAEAGRLIMGVSPLASSAHPQSCAVFIVSEHDKAADLFIITKPTSEEVAHTVHQVVRADLPSPIRSFFTAALPVERNGRGKGKTSRSGASVYDSEDRRVFQLFGLKSDLSLGWALFATSDRPLHGLHAPQSLHGAKQSEKLRKQFLRLLGNAFVVPENYHDRPTTFLSDTESDRHKPDLDEKPTKRRDVIDLQAAYRRLDELAVGEITPAKKSRQLLGGVIHRRGMEELGDSEYMRVRTL